VQGAAADFGNPNRTTRRNTMKLIPSISKGLLISAVLTAGASVGCGDLVSNQGNLGKLVYTLHTDYVVVEDDLKDVKLITGVEHRVNVTMGKDANVSDPGGVEHIMASPDGVTIATDESTDTIGDAVFTVDVPGTKTLQSWLGTELIDYIVLTFVEAEGIDVFTFVRAPEGSQFVRAETAPVETPVYSQATFIGKPVDAEGNELVGDIGLEFSAVPADAAVEVYNLDAVYENGVWGSDSPINVLFVKTGSVTIVLTEKLTGLQETLAFNITDPTAGQE